VGSAWESLFAETWGPRVPTPDVEALLVNRLGGASESYCVSIDIGYVLTGLIRRHWRGFSGGAEAWAAIHTFFETLRRGEVPSHA
jgi:hypothetical protein